MPEHNLRLVVLGASKADKEFTKFSRTRDNDERLVIDLVKQLEAVDRKLRAELRKARKARKG